MDSSDSDDRRRWLIPLVVAFGFMMEGLDSTIITVAIPNMAASLHETPVRLSLAITSYLLSLAVFIPISGWIADRFGARSVICAAFAVFTVASALCGLSQNLPMLVGMRILQGIGGAMMSPVGRLILLRAFPRNELVRAMSYVTIPSLVGPTLGPILGGLITSYLSWRWIFYANIPFGIGAIVVAFRIVENVRATSASRFDTLGFLICGVALASLQFVLETVGRGAVECGAAGAGVRHRRRLPGGVLALCARSSEPGARSDAVRDSQFSCRGRWPAACAGSASARRHFCCRCCCNSGSG